MSSGVSKYIKATATIWFPDGISAATYARCWKPMHGGSAAAQVNICWTLRQSDMTAR